MHVTLKAERNLGVRLVWAFVANSSEELVLVMCITERFNVLRTVLCVVLMNNYGQLILD